jgi:voltage-gated potassium channel
MHRLAVVSQTGVMSVILTAFLLIMFCSIGILICEQQDPDANIKTAGDAIWWSVTTITMVGYGDKYPVTAEGRIVAMILMISDQPSLVHRATTIWVESWLDILPH